MQNLKDNEAIIVQGFEQFSSHIGHSDSFEFSGTYQDSYKVSILCSLFSHQSYL